MGQVPEGLRCSGPGSLTQAQPWTAFAAGSWERKCGSSGQWSFTVQLRGSRKREMSTCRDGYHPSVPALALAKDSSGPKAVKGDRSQNHPPPRAVSCVEPGVWVSQPTVGKPGEWGGKLGAIRGTLPVCLLTEGKLPGVGVRYRIILPPPREGGSKLSLGASDLCPHYSPGRLQTRVPLRGKAPRKRPAPTLQQTITRTGQRPCQLTGGQRKEEEGFKNSYSWVSTCHEPGAGPSPSRQSPPRRTLP